MSFHFKDNKSAKAFADWLEKSDHQEVRAFVNIQDVDMAWRDCSKGNAMNILCQKLGFMHEQVYAIGDAEKRVRTKFWTTIGLRKEPFYVFKRTKEYCTTDISSNRVCN